MLKKLDRYWNRPGRAAYIFILPSLVLLFIFAFIPLCASIVIGFMHMDIYFSDVHFDGFNNFVRAFQDERFWNALKNTLLFAIIEMVLQIVVGLLVANALVSSTFFNKFSRTILFIPVVISTAATGVMFGLLLDETIGYIPYLCGMLGFPDATFFRNASTAMGTIIAMTVWKNFGYTMSILVVGIQGVSQSYYEAARIDGLSEIGIFFRIFLPLVVPGLMTLGIFHLMNNWNDLLYPLMMTTETKMRTLSAGLALFVGERSTTYYGPQLAGALISILPLMVLYAFFQKYFIASVATSGMKD